MLLLGFVQNRVTTMMEQRATTPHSRAPAIATPAPVIKPAEEMRSDDLRQLVDRSFVYLSRTQRDELLRSLEQSLADPANAPYRTLIVTQFMQIASQVRHAHETLDRLTPEQKQLVATQFTRNFRSLGSDQQAALTSQLRQRALPVPADLSEMMLAELANSR